MHRQDCSSTFKSEFGCRVVNSIISWLVIFAELTILGSVFVILSSAGNSIYLQHTWSSLAGVLVGIASITFATILSYVYDVKFLLIDTRKGEDETNKLAYVMTLFLGCVLLVYQLQGLLYVVLPRSFFNRTPLLKSFFLTSGMAKAERSTKQAAAFKINRMVENAIAHHDMIDARTSTRSKLKSSSRRGGSGNAMLHFQETQNLTEPVGGIMYTFRKIYDGTLFTQEGKFL